MVVVEHYLLELLIDPSGHSIHYYLFYANK